MQDRASRELARQWDARDPLARFRKQFYRPAGQIYFDGNSLGLFSQEAERSLLRVLADWKAKASEGWNPGTGANWSTMGAALAARVANLVGAAPEEVAIANSTALNLHQLLATIYRRQFHRPHILIDGFSSAADRAVLRSHLELRGLDPQRQLLVLDPDEYGWLDEAKFESAMIDPTLQMVIVPTVVCTTGQLLDVARICRAARANGVIVGLDLSHSLGVMPHALDEWEVDFAIWGHGNFLNAGPGAAAGLYLNRRHFDETDSVQPGLAGGWSEGDDAGSDLFRETTRAVGAAALQIGPPPILSMAPLDGALRSLEEAGLDRIRAKSLDLTHFLRCAIESEIPALEFVTPREPERRGGHIALFCPGAHNIYKALRAHGVTADFRDPDIIYLAPAPLYNSFVECWDAVQILRRVVEQHASATVSHSPELVS